MKLTEEQLRRSGGRITTRTDVPTKQISPMCTVCFQRFDTVTQKVRHACPGEPIEGVIVCRRGR